MAASHIPPQRLQEIHDCAAQWGKIVARRAGDPAQANLTFADLERLAAAAAAGLTRGTLTELLQQYAQSLPDQVPCPDCARLCPLRFEERSLTIAAGLDIPLREPVAHCPDCRRDFFPPADPAGPGQP